MCFCLIFVVLGIAFSASTYAQEERHCGPLAIQNLDLSISLLVPKATATEEEADSASSKQRCSLPLIHPDSVKRRSR